ncbi:hypothetical protein F4820DRAFT_433390 [Hypoxylon rubiginosum]|uniref:Uncharacterized protein n=1 Tax=Hypoxylon rubiginosum TaxID=110542 RepID=A0ACB9YQR4_9PEZI|nr:hypothetical protein F4820DRAFT_433390 [Hypoxylon rubiginosum]
MSANGGNAESAGNDSMLYTAGYIAGLQENERSQIDLANNIDTVKADVDQLREALLEFGGKPRRHEVWIVELQERADNTDEKISRARTRGIERENHQAKVEFMIMMILCLVVLAIALGLMAYFKTRSFIWGTAPRNDNAEQRDSFMEQAEHVHVEM